MAMGICARRDIEARPSGASPLPHSTEFQHENAVQGGRGLAPDGALKLTLFSAYSFKP
jgi:hypothetical protein